MIPFENDDTRKKTLILTRGMNKKIASKNENKNENNESNHDKNSYKQKGMSSKKSERSPKGKNSVSVI